MDCSFESVRRIKRKIELNCNSLEREQDKKKRTTVLSHDTRPTYTPEEKRPETRGVKCVAQLSF